MTSKVLMGLLMWHCVEESACQYRRQGFDLWVGKIPWRKKWQISPVYLLGKSHGTLELGNPMQLGKSQGSLASYSP